MRLVLAGILIIVVVAGCGSVGLEPTPPSASAPPSATARTLATVRPPTTPRPTTRIEDDPGVKRLMAELAISVRATGVVLESASDEDLEYLRDLLIEDINEALDLSGLETWQTTGAQPVEDLLRAAYALQDETDPKVLRAGLRSIAGMAATLEAASR